MGLPIGKGERTRTRLLGVAVRRFAADGFRRTAVAAVAEEAGVTPAAVYAYFPSKEALFEAAVDADAAALIGEALARLEEEGGGLASSHSLLLPLLVEGLDRHRLARRVLAGREPEVIDRVLAIPALLELRAQVADELAAGQRRGAVRPDIDPETMAMGLETIVLALLMASLQVQDVGDDRVEGVNAIFEALLPPGS